MPRRFVYHNSGRDHPRSRNHDSKCPCLFLSLSVCPCLSPFFSPDGSEAHGNRGRAQRDVQQLKGDGRCAHGRRIAPRDETHTHTHTHTHKHTRTPPLMQPHIRAPIRFSSPHSCGEAHRNNTHRTGRRVTRHAHASMFAVEHPLPRFHDGGASASEWVGLQNVHVPNAGKLDHCKAQAGVCIAAHGARKWRALAHPE